MPYPIRNLNNTYGDGSSSSFPIALRAFWDDLISLGWRVLGSGDGISLVENAGQTAGAGTGPGGIYDVLTSTGTGAGGMVNDPVGSGGSWMRIATPVGAPIQEEWIFQIHWRTNPGSTPHLWSVERHTGSFEQTNATHLMPPTSTAVFPSVGVYCEGVAPLNGDATRRGYGRPWASTPNPEDRVKYHWVLGDVDEDYDFAFFVSTKEGALQNMFARLALSHPTPGSDFGGDPSTIDTDNAIIIATGLQSDVERFDRLLFLPTQIDGELGVYNDPSNNEGVFATYGIEEPSFTDRGYWGVSLGYGTQFNPSWADPGFDDALSARPVILPPTAITRKGNNVGPSFYKGFIKNPMIKLSSGVRYFDAYETNEGDFRLLWGNLAILWAREGLL